MLVVHGGVFGSEVPARENGPWFFVWGEEFPEVFVCERRRGRWPKPDLHPFAAEPRRLARGLSLLTPPERGTIPPGRGGAGYPVRVLCLTLPSAYGWPLPSVPPPAVEEGLGTPEDARLEPWLVKGLVLSPARVSGLLLRLARPDGRFPAGWLSGPDLLLPARSVWTGQTPTVPQRSCGQARERLRTDLEMAARLFPPLEAELTNDCPCSCVLSLEEVYQFLKQAVPLFEESGLGVQIPAFWRRRAENTLGVRLKLRVRPEGQSGGVGRGFAGLSTLVDFQWELALGGEILDAADYRRLSSLKVPLVQLRGQWVELDPARVEHILALLEGREHGVRTLRDALRAAYGDGVKAGLPVLSVQASGELGTLLEQLRDPAKIAPVEQPPGFCGHLRPYQLRCLTWLVFLKAWRLGACLADDMGLGKTIQAIALLLHRVEREQEGGPVLLVCPTSVVGNWQREVARFAPGLTVLVHHGPDRLAGEVFSARASASNLVITSYGLAHRDVEVMAGVEWAGVILDEAQNIKNPGAARTRDIKRLAGGFRVALTGTPVENRLSELWSIMDFINPGLLGSAGEFRARFVLPVERGRNEQKSRQLAAMVQPFILRRVKTDPGIIADLPEKQESRVYGAYRPGRGH